VASPDLVVAMTLAGTLNFNPLTDKLKDKVRFIISTLSKPIANPFTLSSRRMAMNSRSSHRPATASPLVATTLAAIRTKHRQKIVLLSKLLCLLSQIAFRSWSLSMHGMGRYEYLRLGCMTRRLTALRTLSTCQS
jgi:hypothetical protein